MSAVGQAAVGAAGGPLSKSARDLACGDAFLEGRLCARKELFAGFGQADTARCAYEQRCADVSLKRARTAWLIADGVTQSSAAALRKLRCRATLRNASTPSSAPA
jgi:hypothetical protein